MAKPCSHINCNDKGTVIVTVPSGVKSLHCFTHFYWAYVENPCQMTFAVEKLEGFSKQFRRKSLDEPIPRHELN